MRQLHAIVVELPSQLNRLLTLLALGVAAIGCTGGGDPGSSPSTTDVPTRDEYAQAIADAVRCIEDRGFTASAYEIAEGSFNIQVSSPEEGPDVAERMDAAHLECYMEHAYDTGTAYMASIRPSRDEALEITLQCLLDAGLVDRVDLSDEEIDSVYEELDDDPRLGECVNRPYENPDLTQGDDDGG